MPATRCRQNGFRRFSSRKQELALDRVRLDRGVIEKSAPGDTSLDLSVHTHTHTQARDTYSVVRSSTPDFRREYAIARVASESEIQ